MKIPNRVVPYIALITGLFEISLFFDFLYFNLSFVENEIKVHIISGLLGPVTSLIYGILLIIFSPGLKNKTAPSWYLTVSTIIIYIISLILRSPSIIYFEIISILLSIFLLFLLFYYRNLYVFPALIKLPFEGVIALLVIIFSLAYGMAGSLFLGNQFSPPIKNLNDAFYYTVEVMTTLGFGDILPVTDAARIFTASLVILGVGAFLGMVSTFLVPVLKRRMEGVISVMEVMEYSRMKDHTIFCGYNNMIYNILLEYKKRDLPFVVILRDPENYEMLRNEGFLVIKERADNPEILKRVQIKKAKEVIIASSDDPYNLLVALTVNKLKREYNLNLNIRIIVTSSRNIETMKDFVDEIIDISQVLKEYFMKI